MMPPGAALNPDTDSGEVSPGEDVPRDRLRLLLKEFAALDDAREPWRVLYPLHEVLLLVTCATIASCDDFDDIVAWGKDHLAVLRRFSQFHHGIPCQRWLRALVNRVDPICSAAALRPGLPPSGQTATTSSPLMAKPPGARTTVAAGSRPCTR